MNETEIYCTFRFKICYNFSKNKHKRLFASLFIPLINVQLAEFYWLVARNFSKDRKYSWIEWISTKRFCNWFIIFPVSDRTSSLWHWFMMWIEINRVFQLWRSIYLVGIFLAASHVYLVTCLEGWTVHEQIPCPQKSFLTFSPVHAFYLTGFFTLNSGHIICLRSACLLNTFNIMNNLLNKVFL